MRVLSLTLAVIAGAAVLVGCDDDAPPTPSPTATATARPTAAASPTPDIPAQEDVGVLPARPYAEALSEPAYSQTLYRLFVIEVASSLVQPLGFEAAFSSANPIVWLNDETLWLDHPTGPLLLSLDGTVEIAPARPPENQSFAGGESPSGRWSVGQLASGSGGVIFRRLPDAPPSYRVAHAEAGAWSPTRDVALMTGNWCVGKFDLFLFDPESATLTNLTTSDPRHFWITYAWSPDGVRVAASARTPDHDELVLIDTTSGAIKTIAATNFRAAIQPLAWNGAGTHLLFYAYFGQEYGCQQSQPPYEETYLDSVPNLSGP